MVIEHQFGVWPVVGDGPVLFGPVEEDVGTAVEGIEGDGGIVGDEEAATAEQVVVGVGGEERGGVGAVGAEFLRDEGMGEEDGFVTKGWRDGVEEPAGKLEVGGRSGIGTDGIDFPGTPGGHQENQVGGRFMFGTVEFRKTGDVEVFGPMSPKLDEVVGLGLGIDNDAIYAFEFGRTIEGALFGIEGDAVGGAMLEEDVVFDAETELGEGQAGEGLEIEGVDERFRADECGGAEEVEVVSEGIFDEDVGAVLFGDIGEAIGRGDKVGLSVAMFQERLKDDGGGFLVAGGIFLVEEDEAAGPWSLPKSGADERERLLDGTGKGIGLVPCSDVEAEGIVTILAEGGDEVVFRVLCKRAVFAEEDGEARVGECEAEVGAVRGNGDGEDDGGRRGAFAIELGGDGEDEEPRVVGGEPFFGCETDPGRDGKSIDKDLRPIEADGERRGEGKGDDGTEVVAMVDPQIERGEMRGDRLLR